MKIKTQAYLLIAGTIFIPVTVIFFSWIFTQQALKTTYQIPAYEDIFSQNDNIITEKEWNKIRKLLIHRNSDTEIAIINKNNMEVIYSDIDVLQPHSFLDKEKIMDYSIENSKKYFFHLSSPPANSEKNSLITIMRTEKKPHAPKLNPFIKIVLGLSSLFFIFSVFMVIIISRSIANSVTILKNEAEKVTSGQLDIPIEVRGSNEIVSLTHSLNELRLAVKESKDRQARFIMGISHDLKTPLALIKGYVEAIYDEIPESPEEREKYIKVILKKADDLEILINDLIDFIKVDTGEWKKTWQEVNLKQFLGNIGKQFSEDALIFHKKAEIMLNIPENVQLKMDKKLMTRCFENLFSNAMRYTSQDGIIRLMAFSRGTQGREEYVVQIADNGQGISETELNKIFDMFYRGTSSRREKGSGLGLALVKSIVNSHGWEIKVNSALGKGTEFSIVISEFSA